MSVGKKLRTYLYEERDYERGNGDRGSLKPVRMKSHPRTQERDCEDIPEE